MKRNSKNINDQIGLSPEILEVIDSCRIDWDKSKSRIWNEIEDKIEDKKVLYLPERNISGKAYWWIAASILAFILSVPAFMFLYTTQITTLASQQIEILLPDQSKVTISENSSLSYKPYWWKFSRLVKLDGESFFEVMKGEKFEVISKRGKTAVLGTRFNVIARNENYTVTCESGKVKVVALSGNDEAVITAGQEAILNIDDHFEIREISSEEIKNENPEDHIKQYVDKEINELTSGSNEKSQEFQTIKAQQKEEIKTSETTNKTESEAAVSTVRNEFEDQSRIQKQADEGSNIMEEKSSNSIQTQKNESDTEENKEMNQHQNKNTSPAKDKFRASLSADQIKLLENSQMNKEEKRRAFLESLSDEQKLLLEEQNAERARQSELNKNEEKEGLKEMGKNKMRENSNRENIQQQKQNQIRENSKNGNGGNGRGGI